jgi:hypothetical protein
MSDYRHKFTPDEFDQLASIVGGLRRRSPDATAAELAPRVRAAVEKAEATDPRFPVGVDRRIAEAAYQEVVKAIIKRDWSVITLPSGRTVAVAAHQSRRTRKAAGRGQVYQMVLWAEMPWEDFLAMVAMLARQRDRLASEVAAFSAVLPLREKYPDTRTPAEACEREGLDWRALDMAAAAE